MKAIAALSIITPAYLYANLSSVLYAGQDRAGYVLKHRWL